MAESPNERTASGSETPDLDAWLATRRECPHCGHRTPDGTADLTSWYGFHASVCATLAVDRTAPTAIYNVKTCVECRLLVSAALYNEHQGICREGIPGVTMRSLAEQADLVAKTEIHKSRRQAFRSTELDGSGILGLADNCARCDSSADASQVSAHAARAAEFAHDMAIEAVLAIKCENATGKFSFSVGHWHLSIMHSFILPSKQPLPSPLRSPSEPLLPLISRFPFELLLHSPLGGWSCLCPPN